MVLTMANRGIDRTGASAALPRAMAVAALLGVAVCADGACNLVSGIGDFDVTGGTGGGDAGPGGCTTRADCPPDGACHAWSCTKGACVEDHASCTDAKRNGCETDVDCGGTCPGKCGDGKGCIRGGDCQSGVCGNGACLPPMCGDQVKNGGETDVDCGGPCATKCGVSQGCMVDGDCKSPGKCTGGVCAVLTCGDAVKNNDESDVDCGGATCAPCPVGKTCAMGSDCQSGSCQGTCQAPTCTDGVKNGDETDVDCGGAVCKPFGCASDKGCGANTDCQSEFCAGQKCAAITQIAAGNQHACALLGDGTVYCWGCNLDGQLGDGLTASRNQPHKVLGLGNVAELSLGGGSSFDASGFTCARLADMTLMCWGKNDRGQLGINSMAAAHLPAPVNLTDVAQVSAGGQHTCARLADGSVKCWGHDKNGELGDGLLLDTQQPTALVPGVNAVEVAAGDAHTCAILMDKSVRCWGDNDFLELGKTSSPNTGHSLTPIMPPVAGVDHLELGAGYSFALIGGVLKGWGDSGEGELGNGAVTTNTPPTTLAALTGVVGVSAGIAHACAVLMDGTLYCWGENGEGQLGLNAPSGNKLSPQLVSLNGAKVAQVAAGLSFTCARLSTGALRCWGDNGYGQVGNQTNVEADSPAPVAWP
jgi:alpha-tubulin suppressor-like RCC1 family protein